MLFGLTWCIINLIFIYPIGILLLTSVHQRHAQSDPTNAIALTAIELTEWQLRVRNNSNAFYDLCDSLRLVPNIWSLYEWSDWLTPVSVGHRRFDTIFYVCCLGRQPEVRVDNAEVTKPIVSYHQVIQYLLKLI